MGLRPMERGDIPTVFRLLNEYLARFDLVPIFISEAEIDWWLVPRDSIVTTYVVEVTTSHLWRWPANPSSHLPTGPRDRESDRFLLLLPPAIHHCQTPNSQNSARCVLLLQRLHGYAS